MEEVESARCISAQLFIDSFYQTFGEDKNNLINYYSKDASMEFNNGVKRGSQIIVEYWKHLRMTKHNFKISAQAITVGETEFLCQVTGTLFYRQDNLLYFRQNFLIKYASKSDLKWEIKKDFSRYQKTEFNSDNLKKFEEEFMLYYNDD